MKFFSLILTVALIAVNVDSAVVHNARATTTRSSTKTSTTTSTKTTTKTSTTTTTTKKTTQTPSPTSCASGVFKVEMTLQNSGINYFLDFKVNPSWVSSTYDITAAGQYTLTGTTLNSVAVPGAIVYSVSGINPGPGPPPNSRALYEGIPGTLDPSTGEDLPLQVTVINQANCSLAFTDRVRTLIGVAGFRGGPSVYIGPPGTTTNFDPAIFVRAVPV